MNHSAQVAELRAQFKQAFMPVPPHPDHAPPQGAPAPAQDPAMQQAPQGAPAPAAAPAPGAPMPPPGAPPAEAGPLPPPPVNPDVIAVLQETASKIEQFGKVMAANEERMNRLEQEFAHDKSLRDQRKELINTLVT